MYHNFSIEEHEPVFYSVYYTAIGLLIGRNLPRNSLIDFYPWVLSVSDILIAVANKVKNIYT